MVVCNVNNRIKKSIARRKKNNAPSAYSKAMLKLENRQIKLLEFGIILEQLVADKLLELKNKHNKVTCQRCICTKLLSSNDPEKLAFAQEFFRVGSVQEIADVAGEKLLRYNTTRPTNATRPTDVAKAVLNNKETEWQMIV